MAVHFATLRLPSISTAFANLRARFTAFTGRVKSALKSFNARPLEPVRPLKTRSVEIGTPASSPLKQLQQAPEKPADLVVRLQHDYQTGLNKEIAAFDQATLKKTVTKEPAAPELTARQAMKLGARIKKEVEARVETESKAKAAKSKAMSELTKQSPKLQHVETVEKTASKSYTLETQLGSIQDNITLHPKPVSPAKAPAKLLGEPSFGDIAHEFDQLVSKAALKDFTAQIAVRLARLETLDRKSPEARAIGKEMEHLANELGRALGQIYRGKSSEQQNAFANAIGREFKAELWKLLRSVNGALPKLAFETEEGKTVSPAEAFINGVYNATAKHLSIHLTEGDKPDLIVNGSVYRQKTLLGKGAGGIAFLYQNDQGHLLVVKSKGFGADYEESLTAVDLAAINAELLTHLGLMGSDADGAEYVLKIVGVARTPLGQPVAVLELAARGDVQKLIGKTPPPGVDPKTISPEERGLLPNAVANGLVSPHAERLVKLLLLHDALSGMAFLHEQRGLRHGDFKPGNLFLGADAKVKVADFGTSSFDANSQPGEGVQGTPFYMPPEAFGPNAKVTVKADTWAVGVFAYELFHGSQPFGAREFEVPENTAKYVATGGVFGELGVSKLAANADPNAPVQGVSALDRFLNATFQADPELRPSLAEARDSSLFDDIRGQEQAIRELIQALTDNPQDRALINAKSKALGEPLKGGARYS